MKRRAQASIEFMMVTAISMTLLVAGTIFIYDFTQANTDRAALQQVAGVGYGLVDDAANMYVFGEDSLTTFTGSLPEGIQEMYIVENDTIVFEVVTSKGVAQVQVFSPIPINGTRVDTNDSRKVHVSPTSVYNGRIQFRVTSKGSWVEIRHNT